MQRKLAREEIMQLAEEYRALERWEQVRHNALTLCGEQAHKVKVMVKNAYTYEYYIVHVYCMIYDRNNRTLLASEQPAYPVTNLRLRAKYKALPDPTAATQEDQNRDEAENAKAPEDYFYDNLTEAENAKAPEDYFYDNLTEAEEEDAEFSQDYIYPDKIFERALPLTVIFPALNATYLLENPPTISFPTVYIERTDMGQRNILTREEILKLDKEHQALEQWSHVCQTICYAYEKTAYKAIIRTIYAYLDEYNPKGGYYVQVLDKEGNPVLPDLNTKYWNTDLFTMSNQEEWIEIAENINLDSMFKDIDTEIADGEYIFDSPPLISFPDVYTDE